MGHPTSGLGSILVVSDESFESSHFLRADLPRAKQVADRIFNPFFTTKDGGTGLGLALVHRIITSHSGTITLRTDEKGTAFAITLPKSVPLK